MKKLALFLLTASLFLNFYVSNAASLSLTNIGALSTNGALYDEWWYSATNPTLKGTANDNKDVKVVIDEKEYNTKADSSGKWSLATTLAQGDYDISISSDGENYSFTLHNGQSLPNQIGGGADATQSSQSTTPVPITGANQVAAIIMASGTSLLALYYIKYGRENALQSFERNASK